MEIALNTDYLPKLAKANNVMGSGLAYAAIVLP